MIRIQMKTNGLTEKNQSTSFRSGLSNRGKSRCLQRLT